MPSPVGPDDLAGVMPGLAGPLCHKVINGFRYSSLIARWFSWLYTEDGDFTEAAQKELCAIRCQCSSSSSTSSSSSSSLPYVPPLVSEFKELIVKPDDTLCTAFVKAFVRFPALFYKWFKQIWNADGTFTHDFREKFCDAINGSSSSSP